MEHFMAINSFSSHHDRTACGKSGLTFLGHYFLNMNHIISNSIQLRIYQNDLNIYLMSVEITLGTARSSIFRDVEITLFGKVCVSVFIYSYSYPSFMYYSFYFNLNLRHYCIHVS